jgi:single-stranded DNA-binding protein
MHLRVNSVAITGRLTRAPTLSALTGEESAWELRVAVESGPGEGEMVPGSLHHLDVTVRGRSGERAARELAEGSEVAIQGHLEARAEAATTRPALGIVADRVEHIGTPRTAHRRSGRPQIATRQTQAEGETLTTFTRISDIPFGG